MRGVFVGQIPYTAKFIITNEFIANSVPMIVTLDSPSPQSPPIKGGAAKRDPSPLVGEG